MRSHALQQVVTQLLNLLWRNVAGGCSAVVNCAAAADNAVKAK